MNRLTSLYIKESVIVGSNPETSLGILEKIIDEVNIRLLSIPEIVNLEFLTTVTIQTTVGSYPYIARLGLIQAVNLRTS